MILCLKKRERTSHGLWGFGGRIKISSFLKHNNLMIDVCIVTKDNTLPKGLENIPHTQLIIETSYPIGEARRCAIEQVVSPIFAFIDDDMEIRENWYNVLSQYMNDPTVGAVWGQHRFTGLGWFDNYLSRNLGLHTLKSNERFNTNNCLIRLTAVKDWVPTIGLYCYEDLDIGKYIMSQGYKIIHVPIGEVVHKKNWIDHIKSSFWAGQYYHYAYGTSKLYKELIKRMISPFVSIFVRGIPFSIYKFLIDGAFILGIIDSLVKRKMKQKGN